MSKKHFRIELRIVFYKQDDSIIAHCLEFDLMGDGHDRESALVSLSAAISTQLEWSLEHNDPSLLFRAAPDEYQEMFAAGDDVADGELKISLTIPDTPSVRVHGYAFRDYVTGGADRRMAFA